MRRHAWAHDQPHRQRALSPCPPRPAPTPRQACARAAAAGAAAPRPARHHDPRTPQGSAQSGCAFGRCCPAPGAAPPYPETAPAMGGGRRGGGWVWWRAWYGRGDARRRRSPGSGCSNPCQVKSLPAWPRSPSLLTHQPLKRDVGRRQPWLACCCHRCRLRLVLLATWLWNLLCIRHHIFRLLLAVSSHLCRRAAPLHAAAAAAAATTAAAGCRRCASAVRPAAGAAAAAAPSALLQLSTRCLGAPSVRRGTRCRWCS